MSSKRGGFRHGSGRPKIHEEGKQYSLWLGTGPRAERVVRRFKELKKRGNSGSSVEFLERVLNFWDGTCIRTFGVG